MPSEFGRLTNLWSLYLCKCFNDIKATPHNVLIQDKLVAAYNFNANDHDESVDVKDDEINEVKTAKLVKSCSFLLEHQEYPR